MELTLIEQPEGCIINMEYKGYHIVKNGTKWELRLVHPTERIAFPTLKDLKLYVSKVLLVKKAS